MQGVPWRRSTTVCDREPRCRFTVRADTPWYPAADYRQGYLVREGDALPYCQLVVAPRLAEFRETYAARLKAHITAQIQ